MKKEDLDDDLVVARVLKEADISTEIIGRDHYSVYVLMLAWPVYHKCVYVGMTGWHPYHRYLNHLRDHKGARRTRNTKCMIGFEGTRMSYDAAVAREQLLAKELKSKYRQVFAGPASPTE